jgi:hypothetical protein
MGRGTRADKTLTKTTQFRGRSMCTLVPEFACGQNECGGEISELAENQDSMPFARIPIHSSVCFSSSLWWPG